MPNFASANVTSPMLGLKRNDHSTAAIAGATAYGQIRSV